MQPVGLGLDSALAPGPPDDCAQLRAGEPDGVFGGGSRSEKYAGHRVAEPFAHRFEGRQETGEVFTQVRAEFVGGLGPVPDSVLLGAGQDRYGLREFAVGRQGPEGGPIGPQDVGQHRRVQVVGLLPADRVALSVAGGGHRVDGVDGSPGRPQTGDEETTRGLDGDRDRHVRAVPVCDQQVKERIQAGEIIGDPRLGDDDSLSVDQRDVMVITGPVDAAGDGHCLADVLSVDGSAWSQSSRGPRLPTGRARWPGIRLAVRDPSGRQGSPSVGELDGSRSVETGRSEAPPNWPVQWSKRPRPSPPPCPVRRWPRPSRPAWRMG